MLSMPFSCLSLIPVVFQENLTLSSKCSNDKKEDNMAQKKPISSRRPRLAPNSDDYMVVSNVVCPFTTKKKPTLGSM